MARFRRTMNPIHSKKHLLQQGVTNIASGALETIVIARADDAPTNASPAEVAVGSIIKAVYIEMWLRGDTGTGVSNVQASFEKIENAGTTMTFTQSTLLNIYPNKSNVFYVTQGLLSGGDNESPLPFLRGWFKVPKGFQRMALGDSLVLNMSAFVHAIDRCGIFIFKEYQ